MTFWSQAAYDAPYRQRNFKVQISDVWFWTKSVTKPSYEIAVNEYQVANQIHKYPGLLRWNDVTIVIYDNAGRAKKLVEQLGKIGYTSPEDYGGSDGIGKINTLGGEVIIEQYNDKQVNSSPVEKWTLGNAFVRSINFGQLDYESDEFVQIEIVIAYDWAKLDGVKYSVSGISAPSRPSATVSRSSKPINAPKQGEPADKNANPCQDGKVQKIGPDGKPICVDPPQAK